jgi:hypothetical protein
MGTEAVTAKASCLRRNLANLLTLARLVFLPPIVRTYGLYAPGPARPTAIIVPIAALSDTADGVTARRLHATSRFGRRVDPLADRVFFVTIFATLSYCGTLPLWAVLPLLVRDAALLLLAAPPQAHRPGTYAPAARQGGEPNPGLRLGGVHHRPSFRRTGLLFRRRRPLRRHRPPARIPRPRSDESRRAPRRRHEDQVLVSGFVPVSG